MYKTFNAGLDFDECAVVSDEDDLALDLVTDLEIGIEVVPGMRSELLQTEGDTLLLLFVFDQEDLDILVVL